MCDLAAPSKQRAGANLATRAGRRLPLARRAHELHGAATRSAGSGPAPFSKAIVPPFHPTRPYQLAKVQATTFGPVRKGIGGDAPGKTLTAYVVPAFAYQCADSGMMPGSAGRPALRGYFISASDCSTSIHSGLVVTVVMRSRSGTHRPALASEGTLPCLC